MEVVVVVQEQMGEVVVQGAVMVLLHPLLVRLTMAFFRLSIVLLLAARVMVMVVVVVMVVGVVVTGMGVRQGVLVW